MAVRLPFLVIPTVLGTIATGNEIAAKPASHLGELKHIGMVWRTSGASNVWVRGNFGSAKPVNFVSMVSANALAGTTIRVRLGDTQGEVDGTADYDSGAVAFISPSITREDGLYHSHLELPSLQTKQWWRIDIGGHTGDFEAASLIMGQTVTPTNFYSPGFEFGIEDLGDLELNRFGVVDETDGRILRTIACKFDFMTQVDYETKFRPLIEKLGKRGIVFMCFDPEANTYRQSKTALGWLQKPPFATGGSIRFDRFQLDLQMLSII
jgi:hypothetical protein